MSAEAAARIQSSGATLKLLAAAVPALETLLTDAMACVRQRVTADGRVSSSRLEAEQHAAHGLSWLATYVVALRELHA